MSAANLVNKINELVRLSDCTKFEKLGVLTHVQTGHNYLRASGLEKTLHYALLDTIERYCSANVVSLTERTGILEAIKFAILYNAMEVADNKTRIG